MQATIYHSCKAMVELSRKTRARIPGQTRIYIYLPASSNRASQTAGDHSQEFEFRHRLESKILHDDGSASMTRRWVLALDATYRHPGNTRVTGYNILDSTHARIQLDSASSDAFGWAPAIEYSWKRNLGVLVCVRVIAAGRSTAATITPAVAIP